MSYIVCASEKIPVSKILCIGANYPAHIAEMNPGKPVSLPKEPVVFMKPPSAIIHDRGTIRIPPECGECHHEVELIIVMGRNGRHISVTDAYSHVLGYGVGLDLTLRDVQAEAKKNGRPWTIAKGFDTSAVLSDIVPAARAGDPHQMQLNLSVNGRTRQSGNTADMVFRIPQIIAYVSKFFTLNQGDVIFTGTPPGVGSVTPGDQLIAEMGSMVRVTAGVELDS